MLIDQLTIASGITCAAILAAILYSSPNDLTSPYMRSKPSAKSVSATMTNLPTWIQRTIALPHKPRGCHLVTPHLESSLSKDLSTIAVGMANFNLLHTSAGLTLNENYDPDVRRDMTYFLDRLVPDGYKGFVHTMEGDDDMPAHVKASLVGQHVAVPINDGKLVMGTWQGIWLCEFRDCPGRRNVVVTIQGSTKR